MLQDILSFIDEKPIAPTGEKMTEPKLLSECGEFLVVDGTPGDQYHVRIDPGEYLVIRAGATAGKPSAKFTHSNVAASGRTVHEFKHYRSGGSKFWTERAGVDYYFVIPRSAVKMLPEKGYSYIPAEINGVKVRFNVSGGSGNDGWVDYLHTCTTIGVNHPVRDLKKIAEVAVRNSPFEPISVKPLDEAAEVRWNRLSARLSSGLIEKIAKLAAENKSPVVTLMPGYTQKKGLVVDVIRRSKRVYLETQPGYSKSWRIEYTGAVKSLIVATDSWGRIRVKVGQIDWAATAAENGIAA